MKNSIFVGALAVLMAAPLAAQAPAQNPPTTQPQVATTVKPTTTLSGCLYREDQVPGRKPNVAERAGILEDYILADATAVQLTRNPNGLAAALLELIEKGGLPPGGRWAAHLFVVGTEVARARADQTYRQAIEALRRDRPDGLSLDNLSERLSTVLSAAHQHQQASAAAEAGTLAEEYAVLVNFHPSLDKRLKRLRAQGATLV